MLSEAFELVKLGSSDCFVLIGHKACGSLIGRRKPERRGESRPKRDS